MSGRAHTSESPLGRGSPIHTVLIAALIVTAVRPCTSAQMPDCTGVEPLFGTEIRAQLVTGALSRPVDAAAPPGDASRLFVVEQPGSIRIVRLSDDTLLPEPFLDIRSMVDSGGEKGLLGLAFHPQYASNGHFFVNYTRTDPSSRQLETIIARYSVSATDPDVADPASGKVILSFPQPQDNHNGGQLAFGPLDGHLYVSTGDGGGAGDAQNNAQNPERFLGKILRIDIDAGDPYGIPPSNPFAGEDGILDEIWALGCRNPWRCAFDRATGDFYIADVGQGAWEELNWQPASSLGGENYGWRVREGKHPFSSGTPLGPGTVTDPVFEYPHSGAGLTGCSITGGVVYRGCRMPDLHGTYFFADYCGDWVYSLRIVEGEVRDLRERTDELNADLGATPLSRISAFGTDGRGEAYVLSLSSRLYRIAPAIVSPPAPTFLRADSNSDGEIDVSDAVLALLHLFAGKPLVTDCQDALDAEDDGAVDLSDAVYTLNFLFSGGPPPAEPYIACGRDPTPDTVGCAASPCAPR